MAAIDNADVIEYKNEADHLWEEETNATFYDNSEINIKSELDDTPIDYNVNEEGSLKETVEHFNNIRIKKESVEIEIELEEIKAIDNVDFIECKNEVDPLWEEETNLTVYDNSEINIKSELDDTPIDCSIYNEEAYLKETVENVQIITIKNESFENVNNIEIPEDVKNYNYIEITEKTVKNLNNIENLYNFPGDYVDVLHSEIPEGSPHCERSALRFASQEALDDHKKWSAERADERTVKIIPRLAQPVVVNGVQFAKSPRVELWKYNAPSEYAGVFGAPFKKPKADLLKLKNNNKASNEESVAIVNYDANISGLLKKTKHLEEAKDVAFYTETLVGDKTNRLIETCKDKFICDECGQQFHKKDNIILHMKTNHLKDISIRFQKYSYSKVTKDSLEKHSKLNCEKRKYFCDDCNNIFISKNVLNRHKQSCGIKNNVSNTHSTLEPYSCTKCGMKFIFEHDFIRHMRTHKGEKPYSCTVCNKQFSKSCHLNSHIRTHTGEKPYSCTVCNKQFSKSCHLNSHMRTHTGEKPYACTVCKKQFSESCHLNSHIRTHTGEKPYYCTVCNKQFSKSCHLNSHMRTHTGEKPYACTVCNKQFSERGHLNRHMRTHTGEKPYSCTVCNKQFSECCHLNSHMRTHIGEKPYACTVCYSQFSERGHFNRHMRTHTGEKPYSCTVCKKQFSESCHLNSHMRKHTDEKPYSCTVCMKSFRESGNLNRHMTTHTGEKRYLCTVCKKQFRHRSSLHRHMRTHTGEKPYSCAVCNKQFSESCHLNTHMRTHTGDKPYSCTVCNTQFSQSSILNKHLRRHTGEKPYSCTVCKKQFSLSDNLNKHMRTHTCSVCKKRFSDRSCLRSHLKQCQ